MDGRNEDHIVQVARQYGRLAWYNVAQCNIVGHGVIAVWICCLFVLSFLFLCCPGTMSNYCKIGHVSKTLSVQLSGNDLV